MATRQLTNHCDDNLLLPLSESPEEFEDEAHLPLAVELYELGWSASGRAAELDHVGRVELMLARSRYGLWPIDVESEELERTLQNACERMAEENGYAKLLSYN